MLTRVTKSPYLAPIFFLVLSIASGAQFVTKRSLSTESMQTSMSISSEQPNFGSKLFISITASLMSRESYDTLLPTSVSRKF